MFMGQCHLDGSRYDHLRGRVVEPVSVRLDKKERTSSFFFSKNIIFSGVRFMYVSSLGSDSNRNNGKAIQRIWVPLRNPEIFEVVKDY
jgi:hypothetical protein